MGQLFLKTVFELKNLTLKDLKTSKSTTEKLYYQRLNKEYKNTEDSIKEKLKELKDLATMDWPIFYNNHFVYGEFRNNPDGWKSYLEEDIADRKSKLTKVKSKLQKPMPDKEWLLWFAFDYEATKVYDKLAKSLYELLSDNKPHNIKGEIRTGSNSYEIISWAEF